MNGRMEAGCVAPSHRAAGGEAAGSWSGSDRNCQDLQCCLPRRFTGLIPGKPSTGFEQPDKLVDFGLEAGRFLLNPEVANRHCRICLSALADSLTIQGYQAGRRLMFGQNGPDQCVGRAVEDSNADKLSSQTGLAVEDDNPVAVGSAS